MNCNNQYELNQYEDLERFVATLSADEMVYAGGVIGTPNSNYYSINDYQKNKAIAWWTLSLWYFDGVDLSDEFSSTFKQFDKALYVNYNGEIVENEVNGTIYFRPSIVLNNEVKIINGDGVKENPYVIK